MNRSQKTIPKPPVSKHPVQPFIRRVNATFIFLLTIGLFALFFLVYMPLNNVLEKSLINNFSQISMVNYQSFQNSIRKSVENAKGLSDRAAIKKNVMEYKENQITMADLIAFAQPKYKYATQSIENLVLAQCFVDNTEIAKFSQPNNNIFIDFESDTLVKSKTADYKLYITPNNVYCIVQSLITNDNQTLGFDRLVFDLTESTMLLASDVIEVELLNDKQYSALVADVKKIYNNNEKFIFGTSDYLYQAQIMQDNVFFVSKQRKNLLFSSINHLSVQAVIIVICILIAYIIVIYTNIVRYAKRELKNLEVSNIALGKMASEVNYDALTKAGSRRYGTKFLEKVFSDFQTGGSSPAIIMFDIDLFKQINDSYGHYTGDEVLKQVVGTMRRTIREEDKLFRWGGDEFVGVFF
ncbi:MAG: GGDEF domain-containing protein, partial [Clostridiaceae bacterium]|nr:GGDEF domain-containing protein [Clostridiaceae bacterium]